ncbi:expressed unknown protein [Seminavis robusta]|uniref:Uncharacterized protein n=1 Tax=Seminavis robusta TaxID=568900 RepID=A0A9N8EBB8_9STRA|nr:expressed unknown protein [Seminavis robusta]|eukprot:Sro919_g220110.1 n/a (3599) ;mRNA; r:16432-28511
MDGANIFLGDEWIKTIDVHDFKGSDTLEVWRRPRTSLFSINELRNTVKQDGITYVVQVTGNDPSTNTLDFPWDMSDASVEFVGMAQGGTVFISGNLFMLGRVSFKHLVVDFTGGSLNVDSKASLIFQHCWLLSFDRCPERYLELGGVCYLVNPVAVPAAGASSVCTDAFSEGYQPDNLQLLPHEEAVASKILGGEELWMKHDTANKCETLDGWGNLTVYSGDDCSGIPRGVLCALPVKQSITGRNYSSYYSKTNFPNWNQAAGYLADPNKLSIQTGAHIKVKSEDEASIDGWKVTDGTVTMFKVFFDVVYGLKTELQVGVDSLGPHSASGVWNHGWVFSSGSDTLPSKIHIKATAGDVCISNVKYGLHNSTHKHSLAGRVLLQSSSFGIDDCLDQNVCEYASSSNCGRSLLYYDRDQDCVVISATNTTVPTDLSLDLFATGCDRVTSWRAPGLGDNIRVQIQTFGTNNEPIVLYHDELSRHHRYEFDPRNNVVDLPLHNSTAIPTEWKLEGGSGDWVTAIRITRYGVTMMEIDFASLFGCINVCGSFALVVHGLDMAKVDRAYLNFLGTEECGQLPEVYTNIDGVQQTGREACTSPVLQVATFSDLFSVVQDIRPKSWAYRTARVNITATAIDGDNEVLLLLRQRGLELHHERSNEPVSIKDIRFSIQPKAEVRMNNFQLTDGTFFYTQNLEGIGNAFLELTGCEIAVAPVWVVHNNGTVIFNECNFPDGEKILNFDWGTVDLMYSTLAATAHVSNADSGTMRLTRMKLKEGFPYPSTFSGNWEYPDAQRHYRPVDPTDRLCLGTSNPSDVLSGVSSSQCQDYCELGFQCSGYLTYVDETDNNDYCVLCISDDPCEFDCSAHSGATHMLAESKLSFVTVTTACPVQSRTYDSPLVVETLEECKMLCSFYETCEGFAVELNTITYTCTFHAELDLDAGCFNGANGGSTFYIPYIKEDTQKFLEVHGTADAALLATVSSIVGYDECGALCLKTIDCKAFVASTSTGCSLYDDNTFIPTDSSSLNVSVTSVFPKNRYTTIHTCALPEPYAAPTTKTERLCKERCDSDLSCMAYIHAASNTCELFARRSVQDSIDVAPNCGNTVALHVAYSTESFVSSSEYDKDLIKAEPAAALLMNFNSSLTIEGLLKEECKSVCLQNRSCSAIRYTPKNFSCQLGCPFQDATLSETDEFLMLEAKPADVGSGYLPITGICDFSGETIDDVAVVHTETSRGCGVACDQDSSCTGFAHYPNYGEGVNIQTLIGTCRLLTGDITFERCNDQERTDLYLPADVANTCQALCNVHRQCSYYKWDRQNGCSLYSRVAIKEACQDANVGATIHVGLKYLDRDKFVKVDGECLVDVEEEVALEGCYAGEDYSDAALGLQSQSLTELTPFACRAACRNGNMPFFALLAGVCQCTDVDLTKSTLLTKESYLNCRVPCSGNPKKYCGGVDALSVGRSNLPLGGLKLSQCKRSCQGTRDCIAIVFDDTLVTSTCELHASAAFESCSSAQTSTLYIESIEHTFQKASAPFLGDTVLYTTTASSSGCQRVCDAFDGCHAIFVKSAGTIDNCEIRGGAAVLDWDSSAWDGGSVLVANDLALFTQANDLPLPSGDSLATFSDVFDLDECKSLCHHREACDSLFFQNQICNLYSAASSPNVSISTTSNQVQQPYYVNYETFFAAKRNFAMVDGFCVLGTAVVDLPLLGLAGQCATECATLTGCQLFTFSQSSGCSLYDDSASLYDCSSTSIQAFVLYTPGKFTKRQNGFLVDESSIASKTYGSISLPECASLCDRHYDCLSYRFDETTFGCLLLASDQFYKDVTQTSQTGELFTYFSEFAYVSMPPGFCVSTTAEQTVTGMHLEACKKICDLMDDVCVSFEYAEADGTCYFFSSSSFSDQCSTTNGRTLYLSYEYLDNRGDIVYLYESLFNCFDNATSNSTNAFTIEQCQEDCSITEECFAAQYDETFDPACNLFLGIDLPIQVECENTTRTYLRVEADPYKLMNHTCLRNHIAFGTRLYNLEEIECQALCDAEPNCRYFLHGKDTGSSDFLPRECVLFEAQHEELDDCDDTNYAYPQYRDKPAVVNGRTRLLFCLPAHLELSQVFRSNNRAPLFTKERILAGNFEDGDVGYYLQPGMNYETLEFARADDDRAVRRQSMAFDDGHIEFTANAGYCVAGGSFTAVSGDDLEDVRNAIGNQNALPSCQKLGFAPCSDSTVITFLEDVAANDRLRLKYSEPNGGGENGCLRALRPPHKIGDDDFTFTTTPENRAVPSFLSSILEQYAPTDPGSNCYRNDDAEVISRSYSDGCGFDDSTEFKSEYFNLVSNPVTLQHRDTGDCLNLDMRMAECRRVDKGWGTRWVYAFPAGGVSTGGEVYFETKLGVQFCLTRPPLGTTGSLDAVRCDSTDESLSARQRWIYNSAAGTLEDPSNPSGGCLAYVEGNGNPTLEDCGSTGAQWVQYTKCHLNTYERSEQMKLQAIEGGQCLSANGNNLVACNGASVGSYQFFYRPTNESRMELADSDQCWGKVPDEDIDSLVYFPTGLLPCDQDDDEDARVNWLMTWGDEDFNVLQWQHANGTVYCYDVGQEEQRECSSDLSTERHWREYSSDTYPDYAMISVRPGALVQEFDAELQYQFFLYSPQGYQARLLLARFAQLEEAVELLLPIISQTKELVQDCLDLTATVTEPIEEVEGHLDEGESFFSMVATVLMPLEQIPHIGPVLQNLRLRTISTQIKNACERGNEALSSLTDAVDRIVGPIEKFGGALDTLEEKLQSTMSVLDMVVEYLTRTSYCTHEAGEEEEYEQLQEWISTILDAINGANAFASELEDLVNKLNDFPSLMDANIFGAFRGFNSVLTELSRVVNALSFIETIGSFTIDVPTPRFRWVLFRVNYGSVGLSLQGVGNLLNRVQRSLRNVPGVGAAWRWLENRVGNIVESVFDVIGIDLPDFGIDFDFLSEIEEDVEEAIERLADGITSRLQIDDFDDMIAEKMFDVIEAINTSLPTELLPVLTDFECDIDDAPCMLDGLNISIDYDDDIALPNMIFNGVNYSMPELQLEWLEEFWSAIDDLEDAFTEFFDSPIECNGYTDLSVDFAGIVESALNTSFDGLTIPTCEVNFKICSALNVDEGLGQLRSRISALTNGFLTSNNRRLGGSCNESDEWGVSIPVPTPAKYLFTVFKTILPIEKNRFFSENGGKGWNLYWRKFLGMEPFSTQKFPWDFAKMDPSLRLAIGCSGGQFRAKLLIGPLFSLQFGPFNFGDRGVFDWHKTDYFGKASESALSNFNSHAQQRYKLRLKEFACKVDFVWSTYGAVKHYTDSEEINDDSSPQERQRFEEAWWSFENAVTSSQLEQVQEATNRDVLEYYLGSSPGIDASVVEYENMKVIIEGLIARAVTVRSSFADVFDTDLGKSQHYFRERFPDLECAGPQGLFSSFKDAVKEMAKETVKGVEAQFFSFESQVAPSMSFGIARETLDFRLRDNSSDVPVETVNPVTYFTNPPDLDLTFSNLLPLAKLFFLKEKVTERHKCNSLKCDEESCPTYNSIDERLGSPPTEEEKLICPIAKRYSPFFHISFITLNFDLLNDENSCEVEEAAGCKCYGKMCVFQPGLQYV